MSSSGSALNSYQKRMQRRQSLQVLVVDDMASMRRLIKFVLSQMGIASVAEASTGADAVQYMRTAHVDLLICDWSMPGMTGLDVLVHVRERLGLKDVPVIMVTAEQSREQVKAALEAGVTSYVVKPFQPSTLREHINKCLDRLP